MRFIASFLSEFIDRDGKCCVGNFQELSWFLEAEIICITILRSQMFA
ncbi:hypothetical protein SPPR111872_17240 [Sphingobacterium prati]